MVFCCLQDAQVSGQFSISRDTAGATTPRYIACHGGERASRKWQNRYQQNGAFSPPFLYAWVSEDECAPDL